jgi:hypothetical protein
MAAGQRKLDGVEYELAQEKAGALRRMGERLGAALQALRAFDAADDGGPRAAGERARLLAEAGEALWYYVVQREACGLRDAEQVMREWEVPREVQVRMGLRVKR